MPDISHFFNIELENGQRKIMKRIKRINLFCIPYYNRMNIHNVVKTNMKEVWCDISDLTIGFN